MACRIIAELGDKVDPQTQTVSCLCYAKAVGDNVLLPNQKVRPRLIADTQALRKLCADAGLVPFVVSASALPIVLAAAPLAGFPAQKCRGIEVHVREGKFTDAVLQPLTYARGKIAAAEAVGRIALACGDSFTGDLPMMEAAQIAVAVAPAAGSPLSVEARKRGWAVLAQEA